MSKSFEQYKVVQADTITGRRVFMLRWDWWFDRTTTGKLRMKRVTAEAEAHFPKELRKIYQAAPGIPFIKHLMDTKRLSLLEAATEAKRLFNEKPGIANQ